MADVSKREVFRIKAKEMLLARGGKVNGQLSDFLRSVNQMIAETHGAQAKLSRTECFRAFKHMRQSGEVVIKYRNIGKRRVSESFELCEANTGTKPQLPPPTKEKVVEKNSDLGFEQLRQFVALANPEVQTAFQKLLQFAKAAELNHVDWRARAMMAESKLQEIRCVLDEGQAELVVVAPERVVRPATVVRVVEKAPKAGQKSKEVTHKDLAALRLKVQYDLLIAASKGAHALDLALLKARDELGVPNCEGWRQKVASHLGRTKGDFRGDFVLRYTRNSPDEVLATKFIELAEVYTKIDGKPVTIQTLVLEREAALKEEQARVARMQKGKAESRAKNKS